MIPRAAPGRLADPVLLLRVAIILAVLAIWQGLAVSGLLYRDVVPRLEVIAAPALDLRLIDRDRRATAVQQSRPVAAARRRRQRRQQQ